ncbi:MAG: hypothetical protein ABI646_03510 [Acidobacteriota bacterium]
MQACELSETAISREDRQADRIRQGVQYTFERYPLLFSDNYDSVWALSPRAVASFFVD